MQELTKQEDPAAGEIDELSERLGRWMGRREAFGLMAGRCAAADIKTLRQIGEQKLYKKKRKTWAKEYRSIASHVTPEGVHLNGTTVPLLPENSQQVTAAVTGLLKQIEPKEPKRQLVSFDAALKRCPTATEMLGELSAPLDVHQRMELANAIADLRTAASRLGWPFSTDASKGRLWPPRRTGGLK